MKVYIFLSFFLIGFINSNAQSVHSCFGKNLVKQINAYQTPNLVKSPTQTFNSLAELQSKINSKSNHNGAVYALAGGTHKGTLLIKNKKNLCVYTNPNNPATIDATGKNFGIQAYNDTKGVNSNIEILNFRIKGSDNHGIYIGSDNDPPYAPRGVWVAGNVVFDVAHEVGAGIAVRNAFEGATIKIESNEVYKVSPNKLEGSGEGVYIGEGDDPQDYSSNIDIIGNNLHDLTGEAIDIKRKSANILIEYNKINKIKVHSQGAIVLGLDPKKSNDSYNGKYTVRRNSISNVTTRKSDGNFIVVANGSALIEENVMWNTVKHGIDVYNDCDGPNKNVTIQNNIIWGYKGDPIRSNVGNGNGGPVNNCTVSRTTNIVQSNPKGSECQENASAFAGSLTTLEGFAPAGSDDDNPNPTFPNSISWNPVPTKITASTNQISVTYSIQKEGFVVIQLFNSVWEQIGQEYLPVDSPGENKTTTFSLKPTETPSAISYLQAKLFKSDWSEIEETRNQVEVKFNDNPTEPVGNSIDWNTTPTSITSGTNQISVKYSIDQAGLVVVQLFNSGWGQIGQEFMQVEKGSNKTATLALKPNQTPTAVNYLQAKLLKPNWEAIKEDNKPVYKQIEVTSNSNGKLKNEELNKLSILPNPFNNQTLLNYHVEKSGAVSISIHSADGKMVKDLVNNKHYEAGKHQLSIDGIQLSPGIYFMHFTSGDQDVIEKLYKY